MFWLTMITGIINAVFILDLLVTIGTGESFASLLVDYSDNTVATAVVANIPTDPMMFWLISGLILFFVCTIECLLIYIAFYSDKQPKRWTV